MSGRPRDSKVAGLFQQGRCAWLGRGGVGRLILSEAYLERQQQAAHYDRNLSQAPRPTAHQRFHSTFSSPRVQTEICHRESRLRRGQGSDRNTPCPSRTIPLLDLSRAHANDLLRASRERPGKALRYGSTAAENPTGPSCANRDALVTDHFRGGIMIGK